MQNELNVETLTAQGLSCVDAETHSIVPPIYPSTTFERNPDLTYHDHRIYTRADNPTYNQVTEVLTRLEKGKSAQLFSSGMAAVTSLFQALYPGDHIIIPEGVYGGTRVWLERYGKTWGLHHSQIPDNDSESLKKVIRKGKTKIVWIETPSNPLWIQA